MIGLPNDLCFSLETVKLSCKSSGGQWFEHKQSLSYEEDQKRQIPSSNLCETEKKTVYHQENCDKKGCIGLIRDYFYSCQCPGSQCINQEGKCVKEDYSARDFCRKIGGVWNPKTGCYCAKNGFFDYKENKCKASESEAKCEQSGGGIWKPIPEFCKAEAYNMFYCDKKDEIRLYDTDSNRCLNESKFFCDCPEGTCMDRFAFKCVPGMKWDSIPFRKEKCSQSGGKWVDLGGTTGEGCLCEDDVFAPGGNCR